MEDKILLEIPVRNGQVMTIECTPEFLHLVREQVGYDDDAAIRQFIHNAVNNAVNGCQQVSLPGV